jgi:hypothetical protein
MFLLKLFPRTSWRADPITPRERQSDRGVEGVAEKDSVTRFIMQEQLQLEIPRRQPEVWFAFWPLKLCQAEELFFL